MPTTPLAGWVAREMRAFTRAAGRRRTLPTTVHVGHLSGERTGVPDQGWYDSAIRADLISRAIEGLPSLPDPPLVWITRGGRPDSDIAADDLWLAAARVGLARHGIDLGHFFVITRYGWADRVSGESHEWTRVRPVDE